MSKIKKGPSGYTTSKRYIFTGIRNQGWSTVSCIFEFVDNSIDAKASIIKLYWSRDKNTKLYNFAALDNGYGIAEEDMIPSFGIIGTETEYEDESIGNFGVGGSSALINLHTNGTATIKSTHAKSKKTSLLPIVHTENNDMPEFEVERLDYDNMPGTVITIPDVASSKTEHFLRKLAGVVYFPNYDRKLSKRQKSFEMSINDNPIAFIDPLYRDTNWTKSDGITRDTVSVNFGVNETLNLELLGFNYNFDLDKLKPYYWDVKSDKGHLLRQNSGLYIRVGGRYINIGQHLFPGVPHADNIYNRIRMEMTIPRKMIEDIGIQINKSKVSLDLDNPLLKDLQDKVRSWCREFVNEWDKHRGKGRDKDTKKALTKWNERFNNRLKTLAAGSLAKGRTGKLIEKRVSSVRNPNGTGVPPVGSGRLRGGNTSSRKTDLVKWHIDGNGSRNDMYSWNKDNSGVLHITLNSDTEWGKTIPIHINSAIDSESLLWDIYAWVDFNLKKAADAVEVNDYELKDKIIEDMEECVAEKTFLLNKVLRGNA